ncbi:MAG: Shedu anti-phage system protein SduA domain-containing protein [Planctomycetota bacterium]
MHTYPAPFPSWGDYAFMPVPGDSKGGNAVLIAKIPHFSLGPRAVLANLTLSHENAGWEFYVAYLSYLAVEYEKCAFDETDAFFDIERLIKLFLIPHGILGDPQVPVDFPRQTPNQREKLIQLREQFVKLLDEKGDDEEALQMFLKKNPIIIKPRASLIPKQKLGEECVTDFVIVSETGQGRVYTMVEIEQAAHKLFKQTSKHQIDFRKEVVHALGQVESWACWVQRDLAYLRNRLPGFESPQYVVVVGRSRDLEEKHLARLRQANRDRKNTTLLTYDDLLQELENLIASLR